MATLKNTTVAGTGAITLPVGTTAQRPGTPQAGDMRFNDSFDTVEYYDGSAWRYQPDIVRSGLVLHLDAGEPDSYPGTGATWSDLSAKGNDANLINTIGYSSSNGGYLTSSASASNFIQVPSSSSLVLGANDWHYEIWLYTTSSISSNFHFLVKDDYEYGIWYDGSLLRPHFNPDGAIRYSTFNYSIPAGQWFCLSSEYINSSEVINTYINGVLIDSGVRDSLASGRPLTGNQPINILADIETGAYIGSVKMYNRALSAAEVYQNFQALRGRYGI